MLTEANIIYLVKMDIIMCGKNLGKKFVKKNLYSKVKHVGASVRLWGYVAASGVGNLHFIKGIMNKHVYVNIL